MPKLSGVYPIVATPFRKDGAVDVADFERLVRWIVDAGVDGVVFPGVASEFETLSPAERRELVVLLAKIVDRRVPVVVGVSSKVAAESADYAVLAHEVGAAGVMCMAPTAMKDDPRALVDFYAQVAAAGVPVILQNAPVPIGCGLAPERIAEIVASVRGIEYVKEETLPCGQRITRLLELAPTGLQGVFGGAGGRYITDELARGACGTMPACELVDLHVEQFAFHRAGDARGVRRLFDLMLPLLNFQAVFRMAMTKEVLRRRGVIGSTHVRAVGPVFDAGDHKELDALVESLAQNGYSLASDTWTCRVAR